MFSKINIKNFSIYFACFLGLLFPILYFYECDTFRYSLTRTITDRVDYPDSTCSVRSTWSSGFKRTDNLDYFGCKEEDSQINNSQTVFFQKEYEYIEFGGVEDNFHSNPILIYFSIVSIVVSICVPIIKGLDI